MKHFWLDKFKHETEKERARWQGARLLMKLEMNNRFALGVCFSEEPDLLSQWRGYADNGAGFAITFDKDKLEDILRSTPKNGLSLIKIFYGFQDHEEINQVIRILAGAFLPDADKYSETNGRGVMSIDFGKEGEKHQVFAEAVKALFTVKNGAFREEKEWRLFTVDHLGALENVEMRSTGKALSPYIPLVIPKQAVTSVTIGPTNKTDGVVLKYALEKYGYVTTNVETSTASYQDRQGVVTN